MWTWPSGIGPSLMQLPHVARHLIIALRCFLVHAYAGTPGAQRPSRAVSLLREEKEVRVQVIVGGKIELRTELLALALLRGSPFFHGARLAQVDAGAEGAVARSRQHDTGDVVATVELAQAVGNAAREFHGERVQRGFAVEPQDGDIALLVDFNDV